MSEVVTPQASEETSHQRAAALAQAIGALIVDAEKNHSYNEVLNALSSAVVSIVTDILFANNLPLTQANVASILNGFIATMGRQSTALIDNEKVMAAMADMAQSSLIIPSSSIILPNSQG